MVEDGLVVHGRLGGTSNSALIFSSACVRLRRAARVQNRHQIALLDDGTPVDASGGASVHALEFGAVGRRSEDPGVQHAGQPNVAGVLGLAGDLLHAIPPGNGLPTTVNCVDSSSGGLTFSGRSIVFPLANCAVGDALLLLLPVEDHAILAATVCAWGSLSAPPPAPARPPGPPRPPLAKPGRRSACVDDPNVPMSQGQSDGVSHHHVHRFQAASRVSSASICGQRRGIPLAHLDLAGEAGDPAVLADPEKGIEIAGETAALGFQDRVVADAEEDEDPAAEGLEKVAAREVEVELEYR